MTEHDDSGYTADERDALAVRDMAIKFHEAHGIGATCALITALVMMLKGDI